MKEEPPSPKAEFFMAVACPIKYVKKEDISWIRKSHIKKNGR
jgi:hypothetical protein